MGSRRGTHTRTSAHAHAQPNLHYQGKGKFQKALKVCSWSCHSSSRKEGKTEGSQKSVKYILKPASDSCKRPNPRHHPQLSYSRPSWGPSTLKSGRSRRLRGLFTLTSLSNFHNFCCLEDWPLTLFLHHDSELLSLQLKQLQRDIWNAGSFELLLTEILRSSVSFDLLSHRAQSSLLSLFPPSPSPSMAAPSVSVCNQTCHTSTEVNWVYLKRKIKLKLFRN